MIIGNKVFDTQNNVYIVGILNVTPDSFSDGGKYNALDNALWKAQEMICQGIDIIDVGGESTRPGHTPVSSEQEINRVAPVVEKLKECFDITISLDSYKWQVVQALCNKIDMVNDIWGLQYDDKMAQVVAKSGLAYCLMHNRHSNQYKNFSEEYFSDINDSLEKAEKASIKKEKIILDGGVGFAKDYNQNLHVINSTDRLCRLGYPVMIATSRKSVIGLTLDKPTDQRLYGTLAATAVGVMKGASFVRVHDIEQNLDTIKMVKSIIKEDKWIK
nr:dihydropteroate synthase [uncultured Clostridium sp.]